jgi:predicted amidophosphoribosyltransferase
VPGPLYAILLGYKESPVTEARCRFGRCLRELLCRALLEHRACLAAVSDGPLDLVLPVPSSSRPGGAPLGRVEGLAERVVTALGTGVRWLPTALERAAGEIGHMRPNARAFAVPCRARSAVRGARVLLVDDTYVSGARAQSAAAALRLAGARAVVIVPAGRVLRPDRLDGHAAFLAAQPAQSGHGPRCLLLSQAGAGTG